MPTAFGRAMLASIQGQPQRFRMTCNGRPPIEINCGEYMVLRQDESRLLDGIALPDQGSVLDYGCGIGRHLEYVRRRNATVHCFGIDICDGMLDHCRKIIAAPATFARTLGELPPGHQFDLVMLMGNGLGVLGSEQGAADGLQNLVRSLRQGGRIVTETGNPFGRGYHAAQCTIDYGEHPDGPFVWGYSDRGWLRQTFERLGCTVTFSESQAPGGMFFFAVAQRREEEGPANASPPSRSGVKS